MLQGLFTRRGNPTALSIYNKVCAWWELDAYSGGIGAYLNAAAAVSAANYNLTTPDPVYTTVGTSAIRSGGSAASTFGTNQVYYQSQYVISEIVGAQDHAIAMWINPVSILSSYGYVVSGNTAGSLSSTNNGQFGILINPSGNPVAAWNHGSGSSYELPASTLTLAAGVSRFIGYSKLTSTKQVKHYTDGVLQNTASYTNEPDGSSPVTCIVAQGGASGGTTGINAALETVMIFKTSLTATEHAYLYNSGAGLSWVDLKTAAGK